MQQDIVVRELTCNDDENSIRRIWQNTLREVQQNKDETELHIEKYSKLDMGNIRDYYLQHDGKFFVAENKPNNEIIGFIGIIKKEGDYFLQRLNVSPIYRGNGIGQLLCETVIDTFVKLQSLQTSTFNPCKLKLTVDHNNKSALTLFTKLQFKVVSMVSDNIAMMEYQSL